jgi:hypothetical protein
MGANFRPVIATPDARELIQTRADNSPHNDQFNARQRLPADALGERLRP